MKPKAIDGSHKSTYIITHWQDDNNECFTVYSHEKEFATLAEAQRFIANKSPAPRLKPQEEDQGYKPKM